MASEQARVRVARPGYRPDVLSIVGLLFVAAVGLWLLINFIKAPADFYNLFLIGLTNGCVYGLVALGYSLVYGILELINFAHGDVFMLGGMLVATMTTDWALINKSGAVLWLFILLMLLIAMAFCATINTTIEIVAYRRLRNAPRLAPLITAIGMSFILQNVGLLWLGEEFAQLGPEFCTWHRSRDGRDRFRPAGRNGPRADAGSGAARRHRRPHFLSESAAPPASSTIPSTLVQCRGMRSRPNQPKRSIAAATSRLPLIRRPIAAATPIFGATNVSERMMNALRIPPSHSHSG
jgi:hypothetical protein